MAARVCCPRDRFKVISAKPFTIDPPRRGTTKPKKMVRNLETVNGRAQTSGSESVSTYTHRAADREIHAGCAGMIPIACLRLRIFALSIMTDNAEEIRPVAIIPHEV